MDRLYLNDFICKTIKEAREARCISSCDLALVMERSTSWMSRVENHKVNYISKEEAKKLECLLDISICNTPIDELLYKIQVVTEENRRLKELLIEKWKGDCNAT